MRYGIISLIALVVVIVVGRALQVQSAAKSEVDETVQLTKYVPASQADQAVPSPAYLTKTESESSTADSDTAIASEPVTASATEVRPTPQVGRTQNQRCCRKRNQLAPPNQMQQLHTKTSSPS